MDSEKLARPNNFYRFRTVIGKVFVACALVCLSGCGPKSGATDTTTSDGPMQKPATVEQATQVLDLSTFPLMDGAKSGGAPHGPPYLRSHRQR